MEWSRLACLAVVCTLLALSLLPGETEAKVRTSRGITRGVNGGTHCFMCSVIVALVEQTSEVHNESVANAMTRLCSYLPDPFQTYCKQFVDIVGPVLIILLAEDQSPDRACHSLGLCTTDHGHPTCHGVPEPAGTKVSFEERVKRGRETVAKYGRGMFHVGMKICDLPGTKEICKYIQHAFDSHDPAVDLDHDNFSTYPALRGAAWRGKDCNDTDPDKHPGAIPVNDDRTHDSNCNGIYGVDPQTKVAYETELCEGTQPRGVAVLGDSVSAHFHLPENWFDATKISAEAFKHLPFILENEIDWPEMSSTTGLGFNNWTEVIQGPIDSIYMRLRERNRCNHKDYQNIAVNGASSNNMRSSIMRSLARNQQTDQPLVVFYALIGNDVCNGHTDDTFAHMTTPEEMRTNILKTLQFLDTRLPMNSTVFIFALADGRVLYDSLKDRIHPAGRYWNTFTYSQFYDFLNCLHVTPCSGWMNSNSTIRNMTTERAEELSAVLQDVAKKNHKYYKHFDVYYMDNPTDKAINIWTSQGGKAWQLLEPVDGFHSNQLGQALTTKVTWSMAEKMVPGVFGPTNPNNHRIAQLFGDQGAYF